MATCCTVDTLPSQRVPQKILKKSISLYYIGVNTKIAETLNAHMDSLQWVDSNAAAVERRLQEVTRLAEIHKR